MIEDFDYGLEHGEPEPDEWLEYSPPDNPFTVFMSSYHQTGDLLADHGTDDGGHVLNRMVFSHQVTALEAYLGDTLMIEISSDAAAMQRLIDQDDDLAKEKFTLADISKEPGLVERKVREHMRSILYHNLARVDVLYNTALGIRILNLASDKSALFKAVVMRHDCVHRNGFDKNGNELKVFTKSFVRGTADLIGDFVNSIESAVRARSGGTSYPIQRQGPPLRMGAIERRTSALVSVFGFGSLTFDGWQSQFGCSGYQRATLFGYRRAFNKRSLVNWGTNDNPGITLNLERAEVGKCDGICFEFADESRTSTLLACLRKREACSPTTLRIHLSDGRTVGALTYIYEGPNLIDPATTIAQRAALVRKASGTSGSAIDYVRRNFDGLRAAGLEDEAVTELWEAVLALERE